MDRTDAQYRDIGGRTEADRIRRYADIVENMQIGLYVYRFEEPDQLRLLAANPASTRLTGLRSEDLVGKTIDECFPGLRDKGVPQAFIEVCRTGRARQFHDFDYGDDRVIRRAWSFTVFALPEDSVAVAFEDITERKRAEQALRDSELRFRALFENTNDAVLTLDLNGVIKTANDRAAALLGYTIDEIVGLAHTDLVHENERADAEDVFRALSQGAVLPLYERMFKRKDGSEVPVEISAALVCDQDGRPSHMQSVIRDISERKTAEAALQQAQKLESLGIMAGGIAHDFNNLLTGILGNAMLALEDLTNDDEAKAKVREIEQAALRASELTNQMLAYAGKSQADISPLDLNRLIREMGGLLGTVLSKKTVMDYVLKPNLPAIMGDSAQIRQVVMNLITNASEALGDRGGTVTVSTRVEQIDLSKLTGAYLGEPLEEGAYVALTVADDGYGMDEETMSRIFDPFFTTKFTGRGLGLAAVIGIVRGHNGTLTVESAEGEGTTFTVLIPATEPTGAVGEIAQEDWASWKGTGTILVVDDEPGVRGVLDTMLRRAGFDVIVTSNGPDAIEAVRKGGDEIDAVLLDLTMREMHGDEVFRVINDLRPDLPVVLLTGYATEETSRRFHQIGLAGFVHKPFAQHELMAAVRSALAQAG